jgi:hypothetical protein
MPTKSSGCGRARRETLGTELWGLSDVVPESQESAQWAFQLLLGTTKMCPSRGSIPGSGNQIRSCSVRL